MLAKVAARSPFVLVGVPVGVLTGFLVAVVGRNGSELHLLLLSHGAVLLASAVLIQMAIGLVPIRYLSLPGFFFMTYAIQIFVPAALIALEPHRPAAHEYLLAVQMSLFLSSVGVVIASIVFYSHPEELRRYWKKPLTSLSQINRRQFYLLLFASALLIAGLWMIQVKTIPLFSLFGLRGESYTLAVLREESFKLLQTLPGMKYLYSWNRGMFFPLLIMIALGTYHQTRNRFWKRLFYLSLTVGIFHASLSLAKAPVVNIVFMVGLYYYLTVELKGWRWLVPLGVGLLAFPLLVYLFMYGRGLNLYGLYFSLRDLLVRLFYVPANVLYCYFEAFPLPSGYLHGRSMSLLAPLLGKTYFNTANYIYLYRATSAVKTGFANAAFIGNLYADFGMLGVIFGSLLVGFTLQAAQVYVMRTAKSVTTVAVFVYLCYASWILNSVSFPTVLVTFGFILALGILVVERVIRGSRRSGVAGPGEGYVATAGRNLG